MSIRHYSQRGNRRRGLNPKAQALLLVILGIALLLQISYPLLEGEALRVVTIATVYWGAAAMFLHALLAYGSRYAFTYLSVTLIYAFIVELIGVKTGWPFGQYSYDESLGPKLASVSIVVPFAWAMMAHPLLKWLLLVDGVGLLQAHTFHFNLRFLFQMLLVGFLQEWDSWAYFTKSFHVSAEKLAQVSV